MSALLGLSLNIWNEPLDMFEQPQVHSHFFQPIKIQLATAVATFGRNRAERSVVNRMIFVKARHQNSWSILPSNGHHNRKRLGKVDVEPSINVFPRVQQLERKVPFEFKMRHALDFRLGQTRARTFVQHATCSMQHATGDMQHAACNMQQTTRNMHAMPKTDH